jgi:hypothetical protein
MTYVSSESVCALKVTNGAEKKAHACHLCTGAATTWHRVLSHTSRHATRTRGVAGELLCKLYSLLNLTRYLTHVIRSSSAANSVFTNRPTINMYLATNKSICNNVIPSTTTTTSNVPLIKNEQSNYQAVDHTQP